MVVCQGAGLACGEATGEDISEDSVSDGGAVPLVVAGAVVAETSGGAPAASNHEKVWLLRELLLSPFCVFCLLSVRGRCCRARKPCNSVAGWLVVGVVAALCPISVPICIGGGIAPKDVHEVAGIVDGVVVCCVGGGGGEDVGTNVDHTGKLSAESATAAEELAAAGR